MKPSELTFYGHRDGSKLNGSLYWQQLDGDPANIYGYQLYFLDDDGDKVQSYLFLRDWIKESPYKNLRLPDNILIPSGASKIGIYAVNAAYEESATAAVIDLLSIMPTPGMPYAGGPGFFDIDPRSDRIAGTVTWSPTWNETGLEAYDIVFADRLGTPIGSPIGTVTSKVSSYRFPLPSEGIVVPLGATQLLVQAKYASGIGNAFISLKNASSVWELELNARMLLKGTSSEPLSIMHVYRYMQSGSNKPNFAGPDGIDAEDVRFFLDLIEPKSWALTPPLV
jgi:hypothetical protein